VPEGDTIYRSARTLQRVLAGHTVTRFDTAYAHLDRVNVDTPIAGRIVERCEAAGKHLLIVFSGDLILRTHMRMSGSWHVYRHGERWWRGPQAMRVRIDTADWVAVAFDVPVAEFVTARELATTDPVAQLGPDLLKPDFDRAEAIRRIVTSGARPIAMTLLDQRIVAGIGNVYKSEVLFLSRVNPFTPVEALTDAKVAEVVETARSLLAANVGNAATGAIVTYVGMRRTTRRADPAERLWVYGRAGLPCRECGTLITRRAQGPDARLTYWCPRCQP
jgi:endonuclease VIII